MFEEYLKQNRLKLSLRKDHGVELFGAPLEALRTNVDAAVREKLIALANLHQTNESWPFLKASDYMDYFVSGRRDTFTDKLVQRRHMLLTSTLAEWIEGTGSFITQIIDFAWSITEEATWTLPAYNNHRLYSPRPDILPDLSKPWIVDLHVAMTSYVLACAVYLLGNGFDDVSPLVTDRIRVTIHDRFIRPFLHNDSYRWMGFIDSEHVNSRLTYIVMNVLAVVAMIEDDDRLRHDAIEKCIFCLDTYIKRLPEDGGCDEGPDYWFDAAGSLYEAVKLLERVTDGDFAFLKEPIFRKIGDYACMMHIAGNQYAPFGDGYRFCRNPGGVLFRMGKDVGSDEMVRIGFEHLDTMSAAESVEERASTGHTLVRDLLGRSDMKSERDMYGRSGSMPLNRVFESLQVVSFRESTDKKGMYLCAKGGHNDESHNHNDIGNFVLYFDGSPIIIDVGSDGYRVDDSDERRYSYWQNQSSYHNCPEFNGFMQAAGRGYAARNFETETSTSRAIVKMDLAKAYPDDAAVGSCLRTFEFLRGDRGVSIRLEDRVNADAPVSAVFYFILVRKPDISRSGTIYLSSEASSTLQMIYDADASDAVLEKISLPDGPISKGYGSTLYRLSLKVKNESMDITHVVRFAR